jgi:hypothetical protein
MITDANQREYVIERPQATEPNWRYRPVAARRPLEKRTFADFAERLRAVTRQQIAESPRPPAPAPIVEW